MYSSKVRNSDLISKVLIVIIIFAFSTTRTQAQFYPTYPQAIPGSYGNPGYPTGYPNTYPTLGFPQQNNPVYNAPTQTGRNVDITEQDNESMTHEDSVAAIIEAREIEDLEIEQLRRKIFG